MVINIVAGGPEDLLPDLTEYTDKNVTWVGVDRGVYYLLKRGIRPRVAFGDFDSVSEQQLIYIEEQVSELNRYKAEKDETDLELALNWALNQNSNSIVIFGATGGRMDHLLANIQLLITPVLEGNSAEIFIIDRTNVVFCKGPGRYNLQRMPSKKYVSFVPITSNITDLTLEGFKYPLSNRHISFGSTLCISNELISDKGTFSFSKGILIVIRSHD